jgi:class 3 adenylate cyclase
VISSSPHSGGQEFAVALRIVAGKTVMTETRKLAAILVSDVVGYSRLAGAGED